MKWTPDGPYAIRSGRYLITKNSTSKGWVYLCHYDKQPIGRAGTGSEAKDLCARHASLSPTN